MGDTRAQAAEARDRTTEILADYCPPNADATANALKALWLVYEPVSMAGIAAEDRAAQETAGTPVPVLNAIGKVLSRASRRDVEAHLPLARLLWEAYGREGRAVAVLALGEMERTDPSRLMPLIRTLCRGCVTWEDADRLAMYALEPAVRDDPATWLGALEPWLADESPWVRRAAITVAGRLPMKHPEYSGRCLALATPLLGAPETEVKKAVSFAVRLCARGDLDAVREYLATQVPPADPAATWVLCDAIRSMTKKWLPDLAELLPRYEAWAADPALGTRERRSVESAVAVLRRAATR